MAALETDTAPPSLGVQHEVVRAIMLAHRGDMEQARVAFADYIGQIKEPLHESFIYDVARRAGIWNPLVSTASSTD